MAGFWSSNASFTALQHLMIQHVFIQQFVQGWVQILWSQAQALFAIWWDTILLLPWPAGTGTPKATSTNPEVEQGESIWELQELWVKGGSLAGEMYHWCMQSSETGRYCFCHVPTLLLKFHGLLPKLWADKVSCFDIHKAKAYGSACLSNSYWHG